MTRDSTSDPLVGDVLAGRYEIVRKLARGGMATVYRAHDQRLGRVVAVKVMHEGLGDDADFARKFDREARAVARLSDPHVVGVFDQGRDHGRPYIVMEFVEGCTLRSLITREAPFSPSRALELIEPVVAALAAAHECGLVHRDVKPENVLIGTHGEVKVADFGLARGITAQTVTAAHGLVIGTVSYLPPELVTSGHADARSDIYSTGVVLYELLTGEKPYSGDTPIQVAYAHVNKSMPMPSNTLRRSSHAPLPDYIDALTVACTRRDAEQRPRDGADLLARVRRARMALAAGVGNDESLSALMNPPAFRSSRPGALSPTTRIDLVRTEPVPAQQHTATQHSVTSAMTSSAPARTSINASSGHTRGTTALAAHTAASHTTNTAASPHAGASRNTAGPRNIATPAGTTPGHAADSATSRAVRPTSTRWQSLTGNGGPRTPISPVDFAAHRAAAREAARRGSDGRAHGAATPHSGRTPRFPELVNDPIHRRRRGVVATVLVMAIALGIGCLSWWLAAGRYVDAPQVVGMDRGTAQSTALDAGVTITFAEQYDDSVPSGQVISTTPAAGERMQHSDELQATLSQGPRSYPMPVVIGLDRASATSALHDAGLNVGNITESYDADHPAGTVTAASSQAGSQVRHDTAVDLTLSKGPAPVTVPDFTGKSADEANKALGDLGFKVTVEKQHSDTVAAGTVISQSPASTEQQPGNEVKLVVSDGGTPTAVPDVRARSTAEARSMLEQAGFTVTESSVDPGAAIRLDRVQRTDPDPGSQAPKGSTVTIYVI